MNRLFLAAVGVGLLLSIINPGFLPFVAVGTLLGLAPLVARLARERRSVKVALLVGSIALLPVAGVLLCGAGRLESPRVVVSVAYSATAALDGDPERLSLDEELVLKPADVADAAKLAARNPDVYKRSKRVANLRVALTADITAGLATRGWTPAARTTEGLTFTRERDRAITVPTLRGERGNSFEVPRFRLETVPSSSYLVELQPASSSRATLLAERYAIGDTYPAGERETRQVGDREEIKVPMPDIGDEIELRVRNQWLRNGAGAKAADLTFSSLVSWLLLAVIAVANDGVKAFLKRVWRRIRGKPEAAEAAA